MSEVLLTGIEVKKGVLNECLKLQSELVAVAKNFMEQAHESANEQEVGGEDKMESFREQCHADRDMYAIKYRDAVNNLMTLKKINPEIESNEVRPGAIVITAQQNLFVSISLGQVNFDGESFVAISTQSPLYQIIQNKKAGDKFSFRGRDIVITDII